jgi:bacteriocin-like protein
MSKAKPAKTVKTSTKSKGKELSMDDLQQVSGGDESPKEIKASRPFVKTIIKTTGR